MGEGPCLSCSKLASAGLVSFPVGVLKFAFETVCVVQTPEAGSELLARQAEQAISTADTRRRDGNSQ
jgi:hypothetical protein